MEKAFTLLELIVVLVILGVLATLGFTQYGRMVEKSRGAEAKAILGDIRKLAVAFWLQNGTISGFAAANANIGTAEDQIPSACVSTHYFSYGVVSGAFCLQFGTFIVLPLLQPGALPVVKIRKVTRLTRSRSKRILL